jgi:hypothetical protein
MLTNAKFSVLFLLVAMIGLVNFAAAQSTENNEGRQNRNTRAAMVQGRAAAATNRHAAAPADAASTTKTDSQEDADTQSELFGWSPRREKPEPIVGTWSVHIPTSNTGLPPFNALQTFHDGGTFTESSDLLITQTEGPAFGVWKGNGHRYNLTFQLFAFDPDKKESVGMVRVRAFIRMISDDEFEAESVVDFIAPDGTIEKGIDGGPFTGKRVKVIAPNK